jgi:hypothetical protein
MKRDLQKELLERVDEQVRSGSPPAAAEALRRLQAEGKSPDEARRLISAALLAEMHAAARDGRGFDPFGYSRALDALPRILKR